MSNNVVERVSQTIEHAICHCGKICKSVQGLKTHQRTCKPIAVEPISIVVPVSTIEIRFVPAIFETIEYYAENSYEQIETSSMTEYIPQQSQSIQTEIDDVKQTVQMTCLKCALKDQPTGLQIQHTEIQPFETVKTTKIPMYTYDIDLVKLYNGGYVIALDGRKIHQINNLQLLSDQHAVRFQPLNAKPLSIEEYNKLYTKETTPNAFCPTVGTHKGFRMKLATEISLNHKFVFPEKILQMFFDLETFNDGNYMSVPKPHEKGTYIGCIQLLVQYPDDRRFVYLFTRKQYNVEEYILKKNLDIKHLQVITYDSDREMCDAFLMTIIGDSDEFKATPRLVVGFAACIDLDTKSDLSFWQKGFCGYDLNWIVSRSSLKLKAQNCEYKISQDTKVVMTRGIKGVPNLYFHDAYCLFSKMLLSDDLKQMESKTLDGFLKTFGIDLKKAHEYHVLQKILHLAVEDPTSVFEYALYDVICLADAFKKKDIISKLANEMLICNVPLSFQLYETANTKNQIIIAREFITQQLTPAYISIQDPNQVSTEKTVSYKGADTFAEPKYMLRVVGYVLCHDFAGLYPSTIIDQNLSPDTFVPNPTEEEKLLCNMIDCSDDPVIKGVVYFWKSSVKMGIVPTVCHNFLRERKAVRAKQALVPYNSPEWRALESQQKAIKDQNNTIYGGIGSSFSPLYLAAVSAATTAQARKALQRLSDIVDEQFGLYNGESRIIAKDTDSVFYMAYDLLKPYDVINRKQRFDNIERLINKELNKTFGSIISVQAEEIIIKFCASTSKKSYYRFEQQLKGYFAGEGVTPQPNLAIQKMAEDDESVTFDVDPSIPYSLEPEFQKKFKVIVKGASWSTLSSLARQQFKDFCTEHLHTEIDVSQLLIKHMSDIEQELLTAIQNHDKQTIEKYAMRVRMSGKSLRVKSIKDNNPELVCDYLYAVPLLYTAQKLSDSYVPLEKLAPAMYNYIDMGQLLVGYQSQLSKFFVSKQNNEKGKKVKVLKKQYQMLFGEIEEGQSIFRIEKLRNGFTLRTMAVLTPQQAVDLAKSQRTISIHEVISGSKTKLYFDLDGAEVNLTSFRIALITVLSKAQIHEAVEMYVATAHSKDQFSYHITTNLVLPFQMIRDIAQRLKDRNFPVDIAVYPKSKDTLRSVRFIGCPKIDEGRIVNRRFITNATPEQMAITHLTGCPEVRLPPIMDYENIFKFDRQNASLYENNVIQQAIHKDYPNINITDVDGDFIKLEFSETNTTPCPMCDKLHNTTGKLYATARKEIITMKCWKNQAKPIKISIDPLIKPNKNKEIDPDIRFIQEFLPTQNQKYVDFDFRHPYEILCIKSPMGSNKTGKTKQIMGQRDKDTGELIYKSIAILSTRCVFSNNAKQRFNMDDDGTTNGLGVVSYKDYDGLIDLSLAPCIVQVESITRIFDQDIDLLVLDEYESIYEQLGSGLAKNPNELHHKFIRLLSRAKRILVLDSQLKAHSVKRLEYYTNRNCRVIYNVFKPYTDHLFRIHLMNDGRAIDPMLAKLKLEILRGNNVYSHINSLSKLMTAKAYAEQVDGDYAVRAYHGKNLAPDDDGQVHGVIKDKHFKNISKHFKEYNMVMCNSAVGAGLDFQDKHFDVGVHGFFVNASSPMLFVQALFRARKFNQTVHDIWVENNQYDTPTSTRGTYNLMKCRDDQTIDSAHPINDPVFNLQVDIKAYNNAMKADRTNIIIANLKDLGCQIELIQPRIDEANLIKKAAEIKADLPPMKLTAATIPDIHIGETAVEYFLAEPAHQQEMLRDGRMVGNVEKQVQAIALTITNLHLQAPNIGKVVNPQIVQEATKMISDGFEIIKAGNIPDHLRTYELCRQFKPYKEAFGVLHNYPIEAVKEKINTRILGGYNMLASKLVQKGATVIEIEQLKQKIINAHTFIKIPEMEKRKEFALKYFHYKPESFKFIYAIAGLNYETKYKKVRVGKKTVNEFVGEVIQPLPNAPVVDIHAEKTT